MVYHTGSSLLPDANQPNPPGQQNPPGRRRHRYRIFSVAFKLHVVEYAQHHSICTTARHFGLDRQQVPCHREAVGQYSKMEAQLYDFILDERAAGRCVTGGMIRQEASLTRNKLSRIKWLANTILAPKFLK